MHRQPLSPQQRLVLAHAANGRNVKEIARHLGLSKETVKNHMTAARESLHVNCCTMAVLKAIRRGLLTWDAIDEARFG